MSLKMTSGAAVLPSGIVPVPGTKTRASPSGRKGASGIELTDTQVSDLRAAADQVQIVGARYPEENDRMTNLEAPLPPE
jgi:hypothetical protein